MEKIKAIKKKIKEEAEKSIELDSSDIPVHERLTKEENIREIKKPKKKDNSI
ncbi:hypothetical protein KY358_03905 [Candidatus Woesearchaeota archaeon]|nr:hypothetical protein [Candidatus Woesearchaeota archaeon]